AAEEANEKALEGIKGVRTNQNNIEDIINQQKQVIQVLKKFKERVERIEHLNEVDELYRVFLPIPSKVANIESDVESQQLAVDGLTDNMKSISSLQKTFKNNLMTLTEI